MDRNLELLNYSNFIGFCLACFIYSVSMIALINLENSVKFQNKQNIIIDLRLISTNEQKPTTPSLEPQKNNIEPPVAKPQEPIKNIVSIPAPKNEVLSPKTTAKNTKELKKANKKEKFKEQLSNSLSNQVKKQVIDDIKEGNITDFTMQRHENFNYNMSRQSDTVEFLSQNDDRYLKIKQAIQRSQKYPRSAVKLKQQGVVDINFKIKKNGSIDHIKVIKSSNFDALDNDAIRSINEASQYFPLLRIDTEVQIRLSYRLKK